MHHRWLARGKRALVIQTDKRLFSFKLSLEVVQRLLADGTKIEFAREFGLSPEVLEKRVRKIRRDGDINSSITPVGHDFQYCCESIDVT